MCVRPSRDLTRSSRRLSIKDNGRAKLLGGAGAPTTFGKAVIQSVEELTDSSAVVVTIARYETPKRYDINKKGIPVDVPVECAKGTPAIECLPDSMVVR